LRPQAYYSRREAIEEGSEAAYDGYDEGEGEYAGQDASVPVGSSSRPGYYGALGIGRSQTATHGYAYNHPYDFDADPERRGSYDYERVHDPDHDCDYDCDCSYDDDDGSSTVSESSIIDLPRGVLSPLPLELDGALAEGVAGLGEIVGGVAAGVGAAAGAAVDIASGAGNIVRRSASSRFLPRSWTSTEEGSVGGYGTFGRGATPADGTGDADRAQRKGKHSRGGSTAGQ
jgi:hypothetical protein